MNREIPGFYYDPEKKRYFRIESSHTAPPNAAWSSREVAKRRRATAEAENDDKSKRRHGARSKLRGEPERVKRRWLSSPYFFSSASPTSSSSSSSPPPSWRPEPILACGLLAREVSGCVRGGGEVEAARMAEDVLPRAWAVGLVEKGAVRPWPEVGDGRARGGVVDFWVGPPVGGGGDGERELGVVYAVFEGGEVAASYVPRDGEDR
ncbi:hypothetical protein VTJ49DRAFT_5677 [Mycothermus thermophilus]|uniref:Uncharacterized protein n=1 Tax=Humicola insolens TaxID=85995 RepID=A0ABR3V2T4_HUMIN